MVKAKRIPISDITALLDRHQLLQGIFIAWDGHHTYVVTDGVDEDAADQAAESGNAVKRALGWPEQHCQAKSTRVHELHKKIKDLENQLETARKEKHG